jgi:hypothetical protein
VADILSKLEIISPAKTPSPFMLGVPTRQFNSEPGSDDISKHRRVCETLRSVTIAFAVLENRLSLFRLYSDSANHLYTQIKGFYRIVGAEWFREAEKSISRHYQDVYASELLHAACYSSYFRDAASDEDKMLRDITLTRLSVMGHARRVHRVFKMMRDDFPGSKNTFATSILGNPFFIYAGFIATDIDIEVFISLQLQNRPGYPKFKTNSSAL